MTNKKIVTSIVSLSMVATMALPVFAETQIAPTSTAIRGEKVMGTRVSSTTIMQQRIQREQEKGAAMIDQRIKSLNNLISRLQSMRNITDAQRAGFISTVQTLITNLTNLKTQIASETSTTTLKTELQSISQTYRVFALIEPQISVIAAADRAQTIINMMNTVVLKLQSRLASDPVASADSSVKAALADLTAKISDASTQIQSAITEVSALTSDNGDKTKFQSNLATLKDAHSKIQAAQKDIVAARKDVQVIVKVLVKNDKSIGGITGDRNPRNATTSTSTER